MFTTPPLNRHFALNLEEATRVREGATPGISATQRGRPAIPCVGKIRALLGPRASRSKVAFPAPPSCALGTDRTVKGFAVALGQAVRHARTLAGLTLRDVETRSEGRVQTLRRGRLRAR